MKLINIQGGYTDHAQKVVDNLDKLVAEEIKKMKRKHRLTKEQVETIAFDVLTFRAKFPLE